MADINLSPDFFRSANELYDKTTDRKAWLIVQIERTKTSLIEYQTEIISLCKQAEYLGAVFENGTLAGISATTGSSGLIAAGGAVLASIPAGVTQIIGGVLILGSSFISKFETKQNSKQIAKIITEAQAKLVEAQKIGAYKKNYEKELLMINLVPWIIVVILIVLIMKK